MSAIDGDRAAGGRQRSVFAGSVTSRHRFAPHAVAVPLGGRRIPARRQHREAETLEHRATRAALEHEDFIAIFGSRSAGNGSLARMKIARAHDSYTSAPWQQPHRARRGLVEQRAQRLGVQRLGHVLVEAGGERELAVLRAAVAGDRDEQDRPASRRAPVARPRSRRCRAGRCRRARGRAGARTIRSTPVEAVGGDLDRRSRAPRAGSAVRSRMSALSSTRTTRSCGRIRPRPAAGSRLSTAGTAPSGRRRRTRCRARGPRCATTTSPPWSRTSRSTSVRPMPMPPSRAIEAAVGLREQLEHARQHRRARCRCPGRGRGSRTHRPATRRRDRRPCAGRAVLDRVRRADSSTTCSSRTRVALDDRARSPRRARS